MPTTTWSTTDKIANVTLSGANLIATATNSSPSGVRSALSSSAGKSYWEITWNVSGNGADVLGIALSTAILSNVLAGGGTVNALTFAASGSVYGPTGNFVSGSLSGFSSNRVVCFAYDATAGLLWIRSGVGTQWNGSGSANPATGAGGFAFFTGGSATFALFQGESSGAKATANFGDTAFADVVPSGFAAGFPSAPSVASTQARVMVLA